MTNSDSGVDPRFDPIFQRGYDGPPSGAARVVNASAGERREVPSQPVHTEADLQSSRPVVTTEYPEAEPGPVSSPGINPFIILLWVTGPGLAVFGGWLLYDTFASRMTGSMGNEDQAMLQLVWSMAPSAVTVGLAIIAGLLFWHATAWRLARQ